MSQGHKRVVTSRRYVRAAIWVTVGAVAAFVVYLILTRGSAVLVGSLLLLAAAFGTGVVLDRVDNSRRPPEKRPPDWESHPEDYWGFRGRPGA